MSLSNFSSLAGLKVAKKFVCGVVVVGGFQLATVSNLNASCLEIL